MLNLILAILSSSLVSIIMRLSSDFVKGKYIMLTANYTVCAICGLCYTVFSVFLSAEGLGKTAVFGIINGILYLISFILLQKNTESRGVVLSSVFMKLGLLVPIVLSVFLFNELPSLIQTIGFIIAVISIILINRKKDSENKGFGFSLILLLLFGGTADAMSKVYEFYGTRELTDHFLFITFLTAFILCISLSLIKKEKPSFKDILFGVIIGIPNFFSSKFLISALSSMPAVVVYPTFSVATILAVTLTGIIAFKERLNKMQWLAMLLIIISLALLNI